MCDMTHLRVWHDSSTCVTWLIHIGQAWVPLEGSLFWMEAVVGNVYMYTCIHVHIHVHMNTVYKCVVCIVYICKTYKCSICVYMYIHIYTYEYCIYVYMYICIYIYIYVYMYIHVYMYTFIYVWILLCVLCTYIKYIQKLYKRNVWMQLKDSCFRFKLLLVIRIRIKYIWISNIYEYQIYRNTIYQQENNLLPVMYICIKYTWVLFPNKCKLCINYPNAVEGIALLDGSCCW